jgi:hypothetical protein
MEDIKDLFDALLALHCRTPDEYVSSAAVPKEASLLTPSAESG